MGKSNKRSTVRSLPELFNQLIKEGLHVYVHDYTTDPQKQDRANLIRVLAIHEDNNKIRVTYQDEEDNERTITVPRHEDFIVNL